MKIILLIILATLLMGCQPGFFKTSPATYNSTGNTMSTYERYKARELQRAQLRYYNNQNRKK